eukprot:TRINITY_DN3422_c0_g1_i1.p1 TRINITY_DN3422_c0_g1~~TRINITY_DN3422_c0_g1_i1.p1  ORF type:complete len:247 (-),score=57.37 TRINITY_DN3422_c0_g1_i1:4-744(-)
MMLSHRFPDMKIDILEVEPTIFAAAKHFFGFEPKENLRVTLAEAGAWIEKRVTDARFSNDPTFKPYDIVFLDAYDDVYVSKSFFNDRVVRFLKEIVETSSPTEDNGLIVGNMFCGPDYVHLLPQFLPYFASEFPSMHINKIENRKIEDLGEGNCLMLAHNSKFGFGSDNDTPDLQDEDVECDEDGMCSPVEHKANRKKVKRLHRGVCDVDAQRKAAKRVFDSETMTLYNFFTATPFTLDELSSILC